ncbi:MAG: hypothetical protein IJ737_07945 [Ruminococcus sp.]|nr:hypothetical protein [Ruminococcus sp.]
MQCRLKVIIDSSGTEESVYLDGCESFYFEKDVYLPYTKAAGSFHTVGSCGFKAEQVRRIYLYINDEVRHIGLPDRVTIESAGSCWRFIFSSRGFTLLLVQNEPYPEVNANVTLKTLLAKNISHSRISCEEDTPQVNYIYVKERSTVWEAVMAYAVKALGTQPYIRGTGTVSVTAGAAETVSYSGAVLTGSGSEYGTTAILSDVYMADLSGDYTTYAESVEAKALGIIRKKYYPIDYQWLQDEQAGLEYKLDVSAKAMRCEWFSYEGNLGEDLNDKISGCTANGGSMNGKRISAIRISGDSKGLRTRVKSYEDGFNN